MNKSVLSLTSVCFSMSTLLTLAGIISIIQVYFDVSIYLASLYTALFAGTLGFSSLFTPAFFQDLRKRNLLLLY